MNSRTGRMQFTAERVARAILSVISFTMGVSRGPNILEIAFCNGRFVGRQSPIGNGCRLASTEEKDCDESRENG